MDSLSHNRRRIEEDNTVSREQYDDMVQFAWEEQQRANRAEAESARLRRLLADLSRLRDTEQVES